MSAVHFRRVDDPSRENIIALVQSIVDSSGLREADLGRACLIKFNAMSREVMPGRNTSPWVFEAVLRVLTSSFPGVRFVAGDSDVAGYPQFDDACRNWGFDVIAAAYGVPLLKLSSQPFVERKIDSPFFDSLFFPQTVFDVDSIVNVPVMKTHVLSGITCCLKNHWGLLPRVRYKFHPHVTEVIAELNWQCEKTVLNIVDGTVGMESSGPKTGRPKICSVLFGGRDRVAVDAAVLHFMDLPLETAPHVRRSAERGVGSLAFEIEGRDFSPDPFEAASIAKDVVSLLEVKLRSIPLLGKLLYQPLIARILGYLGTRYNELIWFPRLGRKYCRMVFNTPYEPEFRRLIEASQR